MSHLICQNCHLVTLEKEFADPTSGYPLPSTDEEIQCPHCEWWGTIDNNQFIQVLLRKEYPGIWRNITLDCTSDIWTFLTEGVPEETDPPISLREPHPYKPSYKVTKHHWRQTTLGLICTVYFLPEMETVL